MKRILSLIAISFALTSCANKKLKHDHAMLEKYPKCYHKNVKISKACIEKNEAGNDVTALELENTAYPGQYQ